MVPSLLASSAWERLASTRERMSASMDGILGIGLRIFGAELGISIKRFFSVHSAASWHDLLHSLLWRSLSPLTASFWDFLTKTWSTITRRPLAVTYMPRAMPSAALARSSQSFPSICLTCGSRRLSRPILSIISSNRTSRA